VPSLRRPAYTGHENLPEVSLVHMNGRVYDPNVSHMLSADPFVQFPGDGQSHNRYSYVFNNPLRYTDPSGFCLPVYNAPSSFCNNPLAGSGLLGRGSSNPSVGTTQTVSMSGRWGFNVSGGFNAGGGYCNGPGIADCTGTPQTGISLGVVQAVWDVSAVYTVTYAGLLAGDSGESAGGAMAAATVARYEHSVVGPSASPLLMAPGTPDAKQEGVSWSETAHLVLAGASIGMDATGIGAAFSWIPDLVDAGVSALEGDWKGAGMSLWGAIPIIGNVADTAKIGRILKKIADSAPIHHICTNKNCISAATGGPWTPRFEAIFEKAGMNLEDALNKIAVPGHRGPHPEAYHQAVFDRLTSATNGKSGGAYRDALQAELRAIGREIQAPGSVLNQLVTNP
jgi:RHS repeat-associated protein